MNEFGFGRKASIKTMANAAGLKPFTPKTKFMNDPLLLIQNAKQFLAQFAAGGVGANLDFALKVANLLNDDAQLNPGQRIFVRSIIQAGPGEEPTARMMQIATFINTCH